MNSIRRRLTGELFAAILLLQGAGLLTVYLVARSGAEGEFDNALRAKALAVSTLIAYTPSGIRADMADFYLGVGDTDALRRRLRPTDANSYRRFLQEFQHHGRHNYFELWDDQGHPLARSESLGASDLPRRVGVPDKPLIWNFTEFNGEPGRAIGFVFQPTAIGTDDVDKPGHRQVQLVVGAEREALDAKLMRLALVVAGCGILLLGATVWLVPRVLRRGLAPLDRLGEDVARIDAERLTERLQLPNAPKELHPIIERLNELLERLERSFERERRFTSDVAHELRTPLAELRALVEFGIKWPETKDAASDREILHVTRQMQTMFERMLALARGEQGISDLRFETVALPGTVEGVCRSFAAKAEAKGIVWNVELAAAEAKADGLLLKAILTIVIENAVEYAPAGTEVQIRTERGGAEAWVSVSNLALELDPADVERIFDRFWRKEVARSGAGLHLGIGLSLAKIYASTMGWRLDAQIDSDRRLSIVLCGPAFSARELAAV